MYGRELRDIAYLVVIVQQLLAVKGLQASQHSLTDSPNSNGSDNFAFKIV